VSEFTKVVQVKSQDGLTPISPADVAYIENRARAAHYLMADGKEVIGQTNRGKFEESVQSVVEENANFIHPHKSFYVNLHFVRALKADYLLMENGTKVPISRRNMAETKHIYLEYLSRSGGRA
jgi:DNA-binding LytR/AlgR family response regulator